MKFSIFSTFFLLSIVTYAQIPTQTVRLNLFDNESNFPIVGARIQVMIDPPLFAKSDINGQASITNVPVGRQQFNITSVGYESKTITSEVNSGKELFLNVPMLERIIEKNEGLEC